MLAGMCVWLCYWPFRMFATTRLRFGYRKSKYTKSSRFVFVMDQMSSSNFHILFMRDVSHENKSIFKISATLNIINAEKCAQTHSTAPRLESDYVKTIANAMKKEI